jgi:hypothetical protein
MNQQNLNLLNELETKRKIILDSYRKKQEFRVSRGKSTWIPYEKFNIDYNLREILNDEIVIEFDMPEDYKGGISSFRDEVSFPAINFTAINLFYSGYSFEIWEHGGKSPHIHIHELPITDLDKEKRHLFKKMFIKKYIPEEYLPYTDFSLTGIHLIAIEYCFHWKGKYSIKELLNKWESPQ